MCCAVYSSDPHSLPDSDFEPGTVAHLVGGNTGRLLDARRTPVRVREVRLHDGMFEVEILDFEDAGAVWEVPFEDAGRYQFAAGSARASPDEVAEMEHAVERLDRPLEIAAEPERAARAVRGILREREHILARLNESLPEELDLAGRIASRDGDPRLMGLLEDFLQRRGLLEVDSLFTRAFVSNPAAGEMVKGHAIVLAELGLCAYSGKIVRDPSVLTGALSRERRADHLLARLAFSAALWSRLCPGVFTYRAFSSEGALTSPPPRSFVSVTLSSDVALSHFAGGPLTRASAIWRSPLDPGRVLMSFLETRAMNERYREAEVVLVGPAGG